MTDPQQAEPNVDFDELERLDAEVDRCQAIADAGNDGFYMQVNYAEDAFGREATRHRKQLLALARSASEAKARLERLTAAAAHLERCGYVVACLDGSVVLAGTSSYDLAPDDIVQAALDVGWDGKAGT